MARENREPASDRRAPPAGGSFIAAMEAASRQADDPMTAALLYEIAVAAGGLKQKTSAAQERLPSSIATVVASLHQML